MRSHRVVVLVASAALTFAACGSSGTKAQGVRKTSGLKLASAKVLRNTASKSVAKGSAKVTMTMHIDTTMRGKALSLDMGVDGIEDFTNKSVDMTVDMSEYLSQIPGADVAGLGAGDLTLEERVLGSVIYMKMPPAMLGGLSLGDKPWLKLDLASLGDGGSLAKAFTASNQQYDSSQYLGYLTGVSDGVTTVGTDVIRGVSVTNYRATIDPKKALSKLPADVRDKLSQDAVDAIDKGYEAMGDKTIPVDAWIDGDGLLRRMRMVVNVRPSAGSTVTGSTTIDMEMYDYGTPVHVEAPPADQTSDFGDFLGAAGQKLSSVANSLS